MSLQDADATIRPRAAGTIPNADFLLIPQVLHFCRRIDQQLPLCAVSASRGC
jgi:hypothetical protein